MMVRTSAVEESPKHVRAARNIRAQTAIEAILFVRDRAELRFIFFTTTILNQGNGFRNLGLRPIFYDYCKRV